MQEGFFPVSVVVLLSCHEGCWGVGVLGVALARLGVIHVSVTVLKITTPTK